eukprot:1779197-Rhodomonas_salina.2
MSLLWYEICTFQKSAVLNESTADMPNPFRVRVYRDRFSSPSPLDDATLSDFPLHHQKDPSTSSLRPLIPGESRNLVGPL